MIVKNTEEILVQNARSLPEINRYLANVWRISMIYTGAREKDFSRENPDGREGNDESKKNGQTA